jgi:hypothetical protein
MWDHYGVPRTDTEGHTLETVLDAVLGRRVERAEIFGALGVSSSTYFRRRLEADFPNAEELRIIATHFGLNATVMLVSFGLIKEDEVITAAEQIAEIRTADELAGRVRGTTAVPLAKAKGRGVTAILRPKFKYSVRRDLPGLDRP